MGGIMSFNIIWIFLKNVITCTVPIILITWGIIEFWFKKKIVQKIIIENELIVKQRGTFSKFLDLLSQRITGDAMSNEKWIGDFANVSKEALLWCPDSVLLYIGLYMYHFKPSGGETQDINFAKAILQFRKTIGYKNRLRRIKPEHIIAIFKAGNQ